LGTLAAVEDLQRWFGLKVDGIVGPMTWKLLYG
jgi:peptidoglycan hydrolase-like protein with peptidoglycan-binding domain